MYDVNAASKVTVLASQFRHGAIDLALHINHKPYLKQSGRFHPKDHKWSNTAMILSFKANLNRQKKCSISPYVIS
jgi:hypothetical protein